MTLSSCTTYYHSPVGLLRISGTNKTITELTFHDVVETLPPKPVGEMLPLVLHCIEQLIEYFQGQRRQFELPLSQEGTPFQQKVWYELMNIGYGSTISYFELSKRLGDVKTIRAAAAANGKNHIAIIVPCHRVIGSNNDLVGYSGGRWRKKWLLDLEKRTAHGVQMLF